MLPLFSSCLLNLEMMTVLIVEWGIKLTFGNNGNGLFLPLDEITHISDYKTNFNAIQWLKYLFQENFS